VAATASGGGDDGTEGEGGGQRDRDQQPGHEPDDDRGRDDQANRQPGDRLPVRPDVHQRGADRGRVQQRGQQPDQYQFGTELDRFEERQERGADADHHQQQRRGHAHAVGDDAGCGHRRDQPENQ
jgi:hypothetical protein